MITFYANGFAPIYNLIASFFTDSYSFVQAIATIGFPSIIAYYKLREAFAEVQQDQM